jgi:hypothetical protein
VRYVTKKAGLAAMQEHRITWWKQHRNHVTAIMSLLAGVKARASQIITARPSRRDPPLLATCSLPGQPVYLLGMLDGSHSQKTLFLARRARRAPTPNATCRNLLGKRMNSEPKQKRERFQQLTQNPKVKTAKVFAADLRKSKIHPTVKKTYRLAQTKPTHSAKLLPS